MRVNYKYGWRPVGNAFTITKKSDFHHVEEINGQNATEIYQKYLGLSRQQIQLPNVCEFPLVMQRGSRQVARIGRYVTEKGAMWFDSPTKEGDVFRFSYGNPGDILQETCDDARELSAFKPQAVWLIPCMNRRLFFRKEEKSETDIYRNYSPHLAECYGGAELYIDREGGGILNSALLSVGMREGGEGEIYPKPECDCEGPSEEYVPLEKRLAAFLNATTIELEEAAKEAQVANQAKSDFLSRMSHEIRTPINAVLGMDEMILRESTQPTIRDYAMDIYTAGNTLLSLINDILDVSKIESGKMQIIPVEYDLSSVIHDLSGMIALRAQAKNLKLEVSVDETLPSRLYGDDVRLRQVVTNILTNAVKYTKEGTVYFRVGGQREGKKVQLRIEVEDTGMGIKEEDLPKLSQAFERIEEKRNRSIEGTGLGMNITTQLLEMMGSKLCVESVYGKGSKFYFTIEQKIINDTPIGNFEERLKNMAEDYHYARTFAAPDANVLVVDDNSLNRKVFIGLLKQTGMQVTEADSGAKCLELAQKHPYHIIFLDHMMPEMDGIETLHRLKALSDSQNQNTPVYALTANAVSGAKEMYLKEGFDGFISKPIVADKLERVIRESLPPELLVEVTAEAGEAASEIESARMPEDLPDVEGLDWNYAWLHLSDRELLETTVREFYDMIPAHAEKLEQLFENLCSGFDSDVSDSPQLQEALAQYRIRVHSMKSVAGTIGIVPLAGMANTLEYAARDKKVEVIRAMHGILLENWLSYREKLQGVFGIGEAMQKTEVADMGLVRAKLEMLNYSMQELDVDTADPIIDELLGYEFSEDVSEKMQQLKAAVTSLDSDLVEELVQELIDGLK